MIFYIYLVKIDYTNIKESLQLLKTVNKSYITVPVVVLIFSQKIEDYVMDFEPIYLIKDNWRLITFPNLKSFELKLTLSTKFLNVLPKLDMF